MLQVRDAPHRRGRLVRIRTRVGRVPARVLDQAGVGEEAAGQPGQRLPGGAGEQVGQAGLAAGQPGQVQRAGQERPLARRPAPFPPLEVALPGLALPRREALHLRGHRPGIAARVEDAAVGKVIPAHRDRPGSGSPARPACGPPPRPARRTGPGGSAGTGRARRRSRPGAARSACRPAHGGARTAGPGVPGRPAGSRWPCCPPRRRSPRHHSWAPRSSGWLRVRRAQASAAGMPMPRAPASAIARPWWKITANPTVSITAITV